jgi:hypothetical protein
VLPLEPSPLEPELLDHEHPDTEEHSVLERLAQAATVAATHLLELVSCVHQQFPPALSLQLD